MHYPSFGHFLLASILAVQGVQSLNLIPNGEVARRVVLIKAPALALAIPAVAAPQAVNIEAREPHHRGKKTKKANRNRRDESIVEDALEARDIEAREPEPHHRGKKTKKANRNRRDEASIDEAVDHAAVEERDIEAREPHHRGKKTKKANRNRRDESAAGDAVAFTA
ncbi:hypothetical protein K4K56_006536 [Colletotrichum sp. SAR 10_98]|nr:hypothetical protein K4K55_006171 [Colletotrichum sp. SAR 10_96]KAI8291500.1 hypothetical protein K4K56_006536 [Colletotrichum sp. SAR 10_98]